MGGGEGDTNTGKKGGELGAFHDARFVRERCYNSRTHELYMSARAIGAVIFYTP